MALWFISALFILVMLSPRFKIMIIISTLIGIFTAVISQKFLLNGDYFIVMACILLMLIATILIIVVVGTDDHQKSTRRKWITITCILLITLLLIYLWRENGSGFTRILSSSINSTELQERFAYYHDAVRIIKDYPILGIGPMGWSSMQFKYQTAIPEFIAENYSYD